jgi:hypothetical protein
MGQHLRRPSAAGPSPKSYCAHIPGSGTHGRNTRRWPTRYAAFGCAAARRVVRCDPAYPIAAIFSCTTSARPARDRPRPGRDPARTARPGWGSQAPFMSDCAVTGTGLPAPGSLGYEGLGIWRAAAGIRGAVGTARREWLAGRPAFPCGQPLAPISMQLIRPSRQPGRAAIFGEFAEVSRLGSARWQPLSLSRSTCRPVTGCPAVLISAGRGRCPKSIMIITNVPVCRHCWLSPISSACRPRSHNNCGVPSTQRYRPSCPAVVEPISARQTHSCPRICCAQLAAWKSALA